MTRFGLFLFVFSLTALLNRADLTSVDEGFVFNTTAALVEKRSWAMDEELSGRKYSRFSPLPSLVAAPFYAAFDWVADQMRPYGIGAPKRRDWLLFGVGLSSCLVTALTALALAGLLRTLEYSESTAVGMSLLWATGTIALPYSSTLFHQVLATLFMVLACQAVFARRFWLAAILGGVLVSIQMTLAATLLPLFMVCERADRRRAWSAGALAIVLGVAANAVTNYLRGDPLISGAYDTETFTTPTWVGFVGLFFSSGKGLLWYAPIAFVGLCLLVPFSAKRPTVGKPLLFAAVIHSLVLIHWWAWHGSLTFGPRLLLPILPLVFVALADRYEHRSTHPAWQNRLLLLAGIVSIGINLWYSQIKLVGFLERLPNGSMSEWMFVPSLSPLGDWWQRSGVFGFYFIEAVVGLCFSAWLLRRQVRTDADMRSLLPWRALALVAMTHLPWVVDSRGFQMLFTSRKLFPGEVTAMRFPIRGQYRIEARFWGKIDAKDPPRITIAGQRLTPERPAVLIEAPPMTAAVSDSQYATLRWTVPGESQYRVDVPEEYLIRQGDGWWKEFLRGWRHFHWLMYLLTIPWFFDWLCREEKKAEG